MLHAAVLSWNYSRGGDIPMNRQRTPRESERASRPPARSPSLRLPEGTGAIANGQRLRPLRRVTARPFLYSRRRSASPGRPGKGGGPCGHHVRGTCLGLWGLRPLVRRVTAAGKQSPPDFVSALVVGLGGEDVFTVVSVLRSSARHGHEGAAVSNRGRSSGLPFRIRRRRMLHPPMSKSVHGF